jgi:hypothetical protein
MKLNASLDKYPEEPTVSIEAWNLLKHIGLLQYIKKSEKRKNSRSVKMTGSIIISRQIIN